MATRTSTTRTPSAPCAQSADINEATCGHADFLLEDLSNAYFDCRKTKRTKPASLSFELNLERNLIELYQDLIGGNYNIGQSICFAITRPKPREVWASTFRDRIVHHLLYNKIGQTFEKSFIVDSCACIKERGTLYASKRLEHKIRSATQNWSNNIYYAKADLSNFFIAINKNILFSLIEIKLAPGFWLDLTKKILFHDPRKNYSLRCAEKLLSLVPKHKRLSEQPEHLGLPIGNLSSQFFANIYMNELDQYVKHTLKAKHYIRYVDDFILLHDSPSWLNSALTEIESFLNENLAAKLNPKKTIIQPVDRGVDFVGQVIKPWRRTIRKKTKNLAISRIKETHPNRLHLTANSYFGLFRQASHNHTDRAKLGKAVLMKGFCVNSKITKTYKKRPKQ